MTAKRAARPAKVVAADTEAADHEAADKEAAPVNTGRAAGPAERRVITDPRTMRALAHPVRIALLEALGREGELTATRAAEMLDESPGNMSWHLQTLAKYGYVEETGGGKGRSRPWRIVSVSNRFETATEDPEIVAAGEALESTFAERAYARLREWWARRASYPYVWRDAAFSSDSLGYMTAEELYEISDEIADLFGRYRDRVHNKELRPADARPVKLVAFGHPLPPTPSGN
jgi:DNA-binding transcriptional ArsR family regulator